MILEGARLNLYERWPHLYDEIFSFKDYSTESEQLRSLIEQYKPDAKVLLDVACGTGKHLERLRQYYWVEGLDFNPKLLEFARRRCPDVPLHQANMVNFDLGHTFDVVVCLFSSIGYVKTVENLRHTVASMARHLRPGGVVFVEPWYSPSSYWVGHIGLNTWVDEPELKVVWMYTQKVEDGVSVDDVHYLVGTPEGVQHFIERHEMGLFTHEEYLRAFGEAGLEVHYLTEGLWGRGIYVGVSNTLGTT